MLSVPLDQGTQGNKGRKGISLMYEVKIETLVTVVEIVLKGQAYLTLKSYDISTRVLGHGCFD